MYGIAAPEIIIIAIVIFFLAVGTKLKGGNIQTIGPTLVLRKFRVEFESSSGVFVEIVGRASGLTSWLLTILGLEEETYLLVTDKDIAFKSSSLFGQTNYVAPLSSVSSTHCGYSKPIGFLILGVIIIIGSITGGIGLYGVYKYVVIFLGILIGLLFLFLYWLLKKMVISLQTYGGLIMGLTFKRSIIENVAVDIEKAIQAIQIINMRVAQSMSS